MSDAANLAGRILIAFLFLGGAINKFGSSDTVQAMIASIGLPEWLIWPVAAFNLVAAIILLTGPYIRPLALILAAYCLFTSYFHFLLREDAWQVTIMVKNWAIAGGCLILAAEGPGRLTLFKR